MKKYIRRYVKAATESIPKLSDLVQDTKETFEKISSEIKSIASDYGFKVDITQDLHITVTEGNSEYQLPEIGVYTEYENNMFYFNVELTKFPEITDGNGDDMYYQVKEWLNAAKFARDLMYLEINPKNYSEFD